LQKAANLFRQALPLIERTGTRDRLAHLLLPGSQTFWNRGEFILAEQWTKRGLELAQAVGTPYLLCSGQTLLGLIYTAMGDWNQACRYFEESTAMAQKHGLWDRYADTLSRHAFILFYRGEYREAEQLTDMALECATQNKLPVTAKLCNRILAEGYYNRGQFDRAAEYLRQAGIEASRITNSVEANTFLRVAEWWALNGLNGAVSSTRLLSVQEIEQKTQEARKLLEARGFKLFLPTAYRTTALLAWLQGRAEDATHYFKRGLTVARSTSNLPEIARLLLWFSCFRLSCESEVSMRTIRPDLKEAAALFAFLGAAPELQQAEQRLASLTSRR
jgi:tetratricopeptide (TPR) repeat protein